MNASEFNKSLKPLLADVAAPRQRAALLKAPRSASPKEGRVTLLRAVPVFLFQRFSMSACQCFALTSFTSFHLVPVGKVVHFSSNLSLTT